MAISLLPTYTPSIAERFRKSLLEIRTGLSCRVGESMVQILRSLRAFLL